ncbi:aminotransferase class V-fold PLP-dependent enzyme [Providencia hangzhouensis]|uniref:Aminotransferase class V-fold PLP-dependent enzyme n=2 Tax=Providencia TaxID=586 RepID=A0AAJ4TJD5_PRORE|nr:MULTISPECIES: aminotransferase class V-fold PLP-dependent enzyme [Providencia]MBJ9972833.1 aminotransferase class V-fold PLP-dependent enzyme [Providencia rettgeri]MCF8964670.1 putative cysteine desulfurase [Providencia rettgeri]MDB9568349.1 aminotransferase class V-fold PLP-dependent enzyme [Providencia rettgeri]QWQ18164.1 aminotransferase class V-fold PLP-dependent enzyme [Providencia rettgeri]QWQ21997.1 aminotransferase class V-fold PLP-dependent enzyme [Providencia rettgeri]
MTNIWSQVQKDTLVSQHYAYFDTGAAAPPPKPIIDAVKRYLDKTAEQGTYLPSFRKQTYEQVEICRQKLAAFIGAKPSEIAFTKNGTESISLIARGISWQAGDEVIIPDTEMLSNIAIWQLLAHEKGIKIIKVSADSYGVLSPESIEQAITSKTKLISFVALSNITGVIQPVQAICDIARKHGVLSHISASQAIGMYNVNVQKWQCDFMSSCGRKGLRAIEGSGILFVRESLVPSLTPTLVGWWNSSIDPQTGDVILPQTAKRFEAGCPNVPAIISLDSALDYAVNIGIEQIETRNQTLTQYAMQQLSQLSGVEIYGPNNSHQRIGIIPFNINGIPSDVLMQKLEAKNIIIESGHFMATAILKFYQIEKMARLSLHYFNSGKEIDLLINSIKKIKKEYSND